MCIGKRPTAKLVGSCNTYARTMRTLKLSVVGEQREDTTVCLRASHAVPITTHRVISQFWIS